MEAVTLDRADDAAVEGILATEQPGVLNLTKPNLETLRCLRGTPSLRELRIRDATRLASLAGIESQHELRVVALNNVPRISDLSPLASCTELREFGFRIAMSRTSRQKVATLAPLGGLDNLEVVELIGVIAADADLQPLRDLPRLARVIVGNSYPLRELAQLAGTLPDDTTFGPIREYKAVKPCSECGGTRELLLVGRRRGTIVCPVCSAELVRKHVDEFERWRAIGTSTRQAG